MSASPPSSARPSLRRTLPLIALGAVLLLSGLIAAALPSALATPPVPQGGSPAPAASLAGPAPSSSSSLASAPALAWIPSSVHAPLFPPNRPLQVGNCTTTPVVPGCGFSAEPAPMGITDYGVSGYGHPTDYAYSTDIFLANFSWSTAYIYSSGQKADFSVQLNVVLNFINGGQNYSFWIQNVPVPVDTTKNDLAMSYANNIWNFSCASTTCNLATNTVTGNGTDSGGVYVWPASANSGCAGGKTGTCDTLDGPSFFDAEVRTFLNPSGSPEVRFCYFDAKTALSCYDTVTFGFAKKVSTFRGFFVDGFSMNPTGLFEDAEWDIGGPGNGASTDNTGPSNIETSLDFWNGHNFQSVPSAWNGGDDTAEAVGEDQSVWSNDGTGNPITVQLNGTTREAFENPAYQEGQVGTLQVWAPGTNTGSVAVASKDWAYQYGDATLTLDPGTYHVWVNSTSSTDMGMCTVSAGAVLNITTPTACTSTGGTNPVVTTPTASPASADVGQTVSFASTLSNPGAGGDTYLWSISPGSGLGCAASTSLSISCTPTNSNVYALTITVTDSAGHTGSATISGFKVYPDPTVAVPTVAPASPQIGEATTFTSALGLAGSGGDTYSWSSPAGLGCSSSTTTTLTCVPTTAGSYVVSITVKDSNGGTGTNSSASVTVTGVKPVVTVPTASPHASADVGESVTFTSTLSNPGAGSPTYGWSTSPASGLGCTSSTSLSVSCTPTTVGTYSVTITATDTAGNKGTATLSGFVVDADPAISGPASSPSVVDVSQSVTFTATVSNVGSGGDTFAWSSTPAGLGCAASTTASDSCTPSATGTYTVSVTVTDSNGEIDTTSTTYVVNADPTVSSPVPSPTSVDVGQSMSWTTTSSSVGTAPDTYAWSVSPSSGLGCSSSTTATWTCVPTLSGTYTVTVTVTDGAGMTATASSAPLTISSTPLAATATSNLSQGSAPLSVSFTGSATGGVPAYSYAWRFGDGGDAVGSLVIHSFADPGTYVVWLWVNDSAGTTATSHLTITVATSSAKSQGSGVSFLGSYWWLLLVIAAVAAAAILAVAVGRRRKPSEDAAMYDALAPAPMAGAAVAAGYVGGAVAPLEPGVVPPSSDGPATMDAPPLEPAPQPGAAPFASPTSPGPSPPVDGARSTPPDSDTSPDEVAPDPMNWTPRPSRRPPPFPPTGN